MGKKPQQQAAPKAEEVKKAEEAKPQKRAKGHRQRGAGTVVTAKEPVVRDGIEVQSWQRIPTQLLQEYCQRDKRPNPQYQSVGAPSGSSRMTVVVKDKKKADKDMKFTPVQSFDTQAAAKEYAALLALKHLQPTIPHERKLPEPYRTTWLSMIGEAPTLQTSEDPEETSVSAEDTKDTKDTKAQQKTTKDAKSVAAKQTAPPQAEAKVKKAPVLDLQSRHEFVSQAEQKKALAERQVRQSQKRNWREQYMRANKPMTVYMSPRMRRIVELVLGIRSTAMPKAFVEEVSDSSLQSALTQFVGKSELAKATQARTSDLVGCMWEVVQKVKQMGFSGSSVLHAITIMQGVAAADEEDDDLDSNESEDEGEAEALSVAKPLHHQARLFESHLLEHLCLHVQEEALPEAFDPRGRNLDVIVPANARRGTGARAASGEMSSAERAMLKELQSYGFDEEDATSVVGAAAKAADGGISEEQLKHGVMMTLWKAFLARETGTVPHLIESLAVEEGGLNDELELLQSIYPDLTDLSTSGDLRIVHVDLPTAAQVQLPASLEIFISPGMGYPSQAPLALLRCGSALRTGSLGYIQEVLMREAVAQSGQPVIFHLVSYMDANLQSLLSSNSSAAQAYTPLATMLEHIHTPGTVPPSFASEQRRELPATANDHVSDVTDVETIASSSSVASKRDTSRRRRFAEQGSSFWDPLPRNASHDRISAADTSSAAYISMQAQRNALPAAQARDHFLSILTGSQVVLVSGETGCGKTTQIPQFILDDVYSSSSKHAQRGAKIVVCQPRRLAATGVARRVAEERLEEVGNTVGYMIRGESVTSSKTRLLFCTNGVLLRRMQDDADLLGITHVIVDEVHERNLDSDFLLVLLRRLLIRRSDFKLILMSATLQQERFANYFAERIGACPTIHIPGFTHPVQDFFLDDIRSIFSRTREAPQELTGADDDDEGAQESQGFRLDDRRLNYFYITKCILALLPLPGNEASLPLADGAILVFLPGVPEITRLLNSLQQEFDRHGGRQSCWLLPLHGSLSPSEQSKVFKLPPANTIKIVLATNVAETSITIPDVTVVIDACRVKQTEYDPATEMPMLVERIAAQDSLRQRRGRAGRVRPGRCYRMILRSTHGALPAHTIPEILRVPLESVVLQLKAMGYSDTMDILGECVDPPMASAVAAAESQLTALQAIDEDGRLTALGSHLASLPCPARIGKMLLYSCMLGCVHPILSIAAGLTIRSPFLTSSDPERRKEIDAARHRLAHIGHASCKSDHLLLARAYDAFSSTSDKSRVCSELCLSYERMNELRTNRRQLTDALLSVGFLESYAEADDLNSPLNAQCENRRIIAATLCAGLYPNVIKVVRPPQKYHETAGGAVAMDAEAKHIKYYVKDPLTPSDKSDDEEESLEVGLSRVWLHPGSINFSEASYNSRWLVYSEKVKTSKVYVRETTEAPVYALLLFGGRLDAQYAQGTISVDGWVVFAAVGRIVALVNAIRKKLDELLQQKLADPTVQIYGAEVLQTTVSLLASDGLG